MITDSLDSLNIQWIFTDSYLRIIKSDGGIHIMMTFVVLRRRYLNSKTVETEEVDKENVY